MNKKETVDKIRVLVSEYFNNLDKESKPKYRVPLMSRLYNEEEVAEVIDTLLTPERLTLNASGELKTEKFENLWAEYIGIKNSIMVNSGSSANLVAFYMLTNPTVRNNIKPGSEVITNSLTWATSVSPIYAVGMKPVFLDSNIGDYSMNVDHIEDAITDKTKAILVVHLLGFPANMDKIMKIARDNNLFVIEDCCEAHGAEWKGSKVGSFGDISTFSFYLSHHITTIEGGMVMTRDDSLAELARIIRSQGVMRNVKSVEYKENINSRYPDIDPRFLFANTGYNFRPSEMEGAFGIVQFKKFDSYLKKREENAEFFTKKLSKFSSLIQLPVQKKDTRCSWFGYPIMVKEDAPFKKTDLISFLESKGIETRPVMGGNYTKHPVANIYENRAVGDLRNTEFIHNNAFFIGVHAGVTKDDRDYVVSCFEEFLSKY